jgi:hypothetical protein
LPAAEHQVPDIALTEATEHQELDFCRKPCEESGHVCAGKRDGNGHSKKDIGLCSSGLGKQSSTPLQSDASLSISAAKHVSSEVGQDRLTASGGSGLAPPCKKVLKLDTISVISVFGGLHIVDTLIRDQQAQF